MLVFPIEQRQMAFCHSNNPLKKNMGILSINWMFL